MDYYGESLMVEGLKIARLNGRISAQQYRSAKGMYAGRGLDTATSLEVFLARIGLYIEVVGFDEDDYGQELYSWTMDGKPASTFMACEKGVVS